MWRRECEDCGGRLSHSIPSTLNCLEGRRGEELDELEGNIGKSQSNGKNWEEGSVMERKGSAIPS
jgi:hypothetical protein